MSLCSKHVPHLGPQVVKTRLARIPQTKTTAVRKQQAMLLASDRRRARGYGIRSQRKIFAARSGKKMCTQQCIWHEDSHGADGSKKKLHQHKITCLRDL